MHALLHDQYQRLRDGDILYFENDLELDSLYGPNIGNQNCPMLF